MEPQTLVRFMDRFFTHLDRLCDPYRISKIETVAETYLAAAGIFDASQESAEKPFDAHCAVQF